MPHNAQYLCPWCCSPLWQLPATSFLTWCCGNTHIERISNSVTNNVSVQSASLLLVTLQVKHCYVISPGTAMTATDPMVMIWTSTISGCQGRGQSICKQWIQQNRNGLKLNCTFFNMIRGSRKKHIKNNTELHNIFKISCLAVFWLKTKVFVILLSLTSPVLNRIGLGWWHSFVWFDGGPTRASLIPSQKGSPSTAPSQWEIPASWGKG